VIENSDEIIKTERLRMHHAFWLAIIGMLLATGIVIFLVVYGNLEIDESAEVVGIVGLFTSVTGTLVGAFFGIQIGSAGVEHERRNRRNVEELAHMALAHLDADTAKEILKASSSPSKSDCNSGTGHVSRP
jgi:hypothetical protein